MMNLKNFWKNPFQRSISKKIVGFVIFVAAIGFADATYLTVEHFANKIPPCMVGGCEVVLTSAYSTVAGIPVSLAGSLFYLALLVLCIAYLDRKNDIYLRLALFIIALGFLVSIYLFALQAFVIHAFCQYCLISGFISLVLFISAIIIWKKAQGADLSQTDVPL